jgi:hypothetical protein
MFMEKLNTRQVVSLRSAMRNYADMVVANSNADDYGVVYHGQAVVDALTALGVHVSNIDRQILRLMGEAEKRRAGGE